MFEIGIGLDYLFGSTWLNYEFFRLRFSISYERYELAVVTSEKNEKMILSKMKNKTVAKGKFHEGVHNSHGKLGQTISHGKQENITSGLPNLPMILLKTWKEIKHKNILITENDTHQLMRLMF